MTRKISGKFIPSFRYPDDQWKAFLDDREGAIVGPNTAKRFGWKIGDRIPLQAPIYGGTFEFNLRGIYHGAREGDDLSQFWIQYKYLDEHRPAALKGQIGWYTVKLDSADDAPRVVKAIDNMFANSPFETKSETLASDGRVVGETSRKY